MRKRAFRVVLLKERDGSIQECRLEARYEDEKEWRYALSGISKRELEYLIWVLACMRNDLKYTPEQPRLFIDLHVRGLIVRVGTKLAFEGCPPPAPFPGAYSG